METVHAQEPATPCTTPKIFKAMASVMRDVGAIGKDQRNQQQGFKYRGIDDVYNALNDVMGKHGVFTTSEILDEHREERTSKQGSALTYTILRIRYHFFAEDGSSVPSEVIGEGMDSGDKSSNKGMAIAHKYALLQAFCIPTQEIKDPDHETHEVEPVQRRGSQQAANQVRDRKLEQIKQEQAPESEAPKTLLGSEEEFQHIIAQFTKLEARNSAFKNFKRLLEKYLGEEKGNEFYYETLKAKTGKESAADITLRSHAIQAAREFHNKLAPLMIAEREAATAGVA